jgi:hypothetical protein
VGCGCQVVDLIDLLMWVIIVFSFIFIVLNLGGNDFD